MLTVQRYEIIAIPPNFWDILYRFVTNYSHKLVRGMYLIQYLLHIRLLLLYSAYYSYSVYCLLKFIEEAGSLSAVHLDMVELKGDGQGCPQPALAVAASHHHRITELVGVLVDDAVEFGGYHG